MEVQAVLKANLRLKTDLRSQEHFSKTRGVFRTLLSIEDGAFREIFAKISVLDF